LNEQLEQAKQNESRLNLLLRNQEDTIGNYQELELEWNQTNERLNRELEESRSSAPALDEEHQKRLEEKDQLISHYQVQEDTWKQTFEGLQQQIKEYQEKEEKYKQAILDFTAKERRSMLGHEQPRGAQSQRPASSPPVMRLPSNAHATFFRPHHTPQSTTINPFEPR
jgi:chromosome segregation ATPase